MSRLLRAMIYMALISITGYSCASQASQILSTRESVVRESLSEISGSKEVRAFDRANKVSIDSLGRYMEAFWQRCDPTPGTEVNEFRDRYEARLDVGYRTFWSDGEQKPDDRLLAYLLYGMPSTQITQTYGSGGLLIRWNYHLPTDLEEAGVGNSLVRESFEIAFYKRNTGFHSAGNVNRIKGLIDPLRISALNRLSEILRNTDNPSSLRAAAAWRLRIEPSAIAMSLLLPYLDDPDPQVSAVLSGAMAPLQIQTSTSGEIFLARVESDPGPSETIASPTSVEDEPSLSAVTLDMDQFQLYQLQTLSIDPRIFVESESLNQLEQYSSRSDTSSISSGWLTVREADEVFAGVLGEARDHIGDGNPLLAHDILDPLLKDELQSIPEAWHLDAIALLESEEPGGRMLAESRIRQALRLDPENLRYRLALARILHRRTLTLYSDSMLDDILDESPRASDAHALKGQIRVEELWNLGWRAGGWGRPVEAQPMSPAEKELSALNHLGQSLVLDPGNEYATWWLGVHFIVSENWMNVIPVMNFLLSHGCHTAEAYLGRGMALQNLGLLDEAMRDYEAGLKLMPEMAQSIAKDPRWVLPPSLGGITLERTIDFSPTEQFGDSIEAQVSRDESGSISRDFWFAKDPMYATDINERLMEQYRRFAFVSWHFAIPNLGLAGWNTHRGRVYLRYGDPIGVRDRRQRAWEAMAGIVSSSADTASGSNWILTEAGHLVHGSDSWAYEGFTVTFFGGFMTGNLSVGRPEMYVATAEVTPEIASIAGARDVENLTSNWYLFRDQDNTLELYPIILVPSIISDYQQSVVASVTSQIANAQIHNICFDGFWSEIERTSTKLPELQTNDKLSRTFVGPQFRIDPIAIESDHVYVVSELIPAGFGPIYTDRDTIHSIQTGSLSLSSLVVAFSVNEISTLRDPIGSESFQRQEMVISPDPLNEIQLNRPKNLFFEVYGLELDRFGATEYDIEVTLTPLDTDPRRDTALSSIVETVTGLIRRQEQQGSVTLVFRRNGISSTAQEMFNIVLPSGESGRAYVLHIGLIDLISERRAEREIILRASSGLGLPPI